MKKRSQIKIQQTVFMLLAVTLFFVLVGLAFLGFKMSQIRGSASDVEKERAIQLVSKIANSPEFSCGDSFNTGAIDCIDSDKVMALRERRSDYSGFWGDSNIEIRRIYPKIDGNVVCDIGNYPNCNIIEIIKTSSQGTYYSNFVSLCRKEAKEDEVYNKCEVAKVMISYKEK